MYAESARDYSRNQEVSMKRLKRYDPGQRLDEHYQEAIVMEEYVSGDYVSVEELKELLKTFTHELAAGADALLYELEESDG